MKRMAVFISMTILLALLAPCMNIFAMSEESVDDVYFIVCPVAEGLPKEDPQEHLHNNLPDLQIIGAQQNSRTSIEFAINGIGYVYRTSVRTLGQAAVRVYAAEHDYSDSIKESIMLECLELYPEII